VPEGNGRAAMESAGCGAPATVTLGSSRSGSRLAKGLMPVTEDGCLAYPTW
jgi:hypothetical protein